MSKTKKNAAFPQLHADAPQVPTGLRPKEGVLYGCGDPTCRECYVEAATQVPKPDDTFWVINNIYRSLVWR